MPIPGSSREKKLLSEIAGKAEEAKPVFLQEIKEPSHEPEVLVEKKEKKKRSRKKS